MITKIIKTYFISGHRNISEENFDKYYARDLSLIEGKYQYDKAHAMRNKTTYIEPHYVLGDYEGVDTMAQNFLSYALNVDPHRITIYYMGNTPMNCADEKYNRKFGFLTDNERDEAMTNDSDEDIAYITDETKWSGTGQNILRRYKMK